MSRLCGRPGCSEPGAVAYGMVPEDLLFWVAPHDPIADPDAAVLCRRHADSMVVPIGWTLDDRREAVPRLFRPPAAVASRHETPARTTRRRRPEDTTEQLELPDPRVLPDDLPDEQPDDQPAAWVPTFDADDDLDGLLGASSPLLARAFRGADRPRR